MWIHMGVTGGLEANGFSRHFLGIENNLKILFLMPVK